MKAVIVLCIAAAGLWTMMFGPATKDILSFWPMMTLSSGLLAAGGLVLGRREYAELFRFRRFDCLIGFASPLILYGGFWLAYRIATNLFGFAAGQVDNIYLLRADTSPVAISFLLAFWIGPAEEIFWRGFVQKRLSGKFGIITGFIAATAIYTLVHVASMNVMLVAAAGLCGGFWGLIFAWRKNLWSVLLSHAIWDVIIFVVFPIR